MASKRPTSPPALPEVVAGLHERLLEVENRLGIDHAAIKADRQASLDAGIAAAPLSEPPVELTPAEQKKADAKADAEAKADADKGA